MAGTQVFGKGAAHDLDGEASRRRKALFIRTRMAPGAVDRLAAAAAAAWDGAVVSWPPTRPPTWSRWWTGSAPRAGRGGPARPGDPGRHDDAARPVRAEPLWPEPYTFRPDVLIPR
ncbi:MAG TPA: hypothetical protein VFT95_20210 [Micromonosporaceae bacterium]|nr:hypothetical protein [Micromonosporaceae bacterium]